MVVRSMKITRHIYSIEEIKNIVVPIAIIHNVKKVVLFGSYARGEAKENSDIDLCVAIGEKPFPFAFFSFIEQLQEKFKKRVDIVDETNLVNEPCNLIENIRKEGILIYEQKS